jgi:hypothetical protein
VNRIVSFKFVQFVTYFFLTFRSITSLGSFKRYMRATKSPGLMSMSKITGLPLLTFLKSGL